VASDSDARPALQLLVLLVLCWLITASQAGAARFRVETAGDLAEALRKVEAGDIVELMDGLYETTRTLKANRSGTEGMPIVLRAAGPGQAVIDGQFGLVIEKSAHVVVEGLTFTHSNHSRAIEVKHSSHVEIRNCTFRLREDVDQSTHWVYVTGTSSHVTIRDCLFEEKHKRGCFVTLDGTEEDDTPASQIVQHCRIENCRFRNVGPRVDNGMEAVRLGDSGLSMSDAHCVLTGCTFENCDGDPEVVSVKCCRVLIEGNTFRDCHGGLCLRHGNHNRAVRNIFVCTNGKPGVGGIRIYGCDHEIVDNTLTGLTGKGDEAPLVLCNGETDTGPLSARFRPQRVRIAHNTLTDCVYSSLDVGYDDGSKLKLPSRDCVIENNTITSDTGILVNVINGAENLTWNNNTLRPHGSARAGVTVQDGRAVPEASR
jgi:poly(beta-D-mannuronate) lyase